MTSLRVRETCDIFEIIKKWMKIDKYLWKKRKIHWREVIGFFFFLSTGSFILQAGKNDAWHLTSSKFSFSKYFLYVSSPWLFSSIFFVNIFLFNTFEPISTLWGNENVLIIILFVFGRARWYPPCLTRLYSVESLLLSDLSRIILLIAKDFILFRCFFFCSKLLLICSFDFLIDNNSSCIGNSFGRVKSTL